MIIQYKHNKIDQKELYWQLNTFFKMAYPGLFNGNKLAGLYSIHVTNENKRTNDNCVYVGQSKNLASRTSTHLSGKYNLDNVIVRLYLFPKNFYEQLYSRSDEYQSKYLELFESFLIQYFKPTENIVADFSLENDNLYKKFIEDNINKEGIFQSIEIERANGIVIIASESQSFELVKFSRNELLKKSLEMLK